MKGPRYIIEVHEIGWLLCTLPGRTGLPMTALSECLKLFPKNAVMVTGVPHHFHATGRPEVIIAVASPANAKRWEEEIEAELAASTIKPELRWWRGTKVGRSSAAIFAALADRAFGYLNVREFSGVATPQDAGDFGRCLHLLSVMPEWRDRLPEVATAYPGTKWPAIIDRWAELESATPERQFEILKEIHR